MVGASPRSRFEPPRVDERHILRPRLLAELQRRWEARLVLLVAGAGAGKTSLLAQAVAENQLRPYGDDRWLACGPPHGNADVLVGDLWRALRLGGVEPTTVDELVEAVYGLRGPTVIVLDDAHRLGPDGSGRTAVAQLVRDAPPNLHFVLAAREEPGVPLARLEAQGAVVRIESESFAFSPDERLEVAGHWGADVETVEAVGGWPGLSALEVGAGSHGPIRFLFEEIVDGLAPADREELAALIAMGGATPGDVEAALGRPSRLAELAATVPLLSVRADGLVVAHELWSDPDLQIISGVDADAIRVRAAEVVLDQGLVDRAFDLFVGSSEPARVVEVVDFACSNNAFDPRSEQLEAWLDRLPPELADHAVQPLLLGMSDLAGGEQGERTCDVLVESVERARAAGLPDIEMAAIAMAIWALSSCGRDDEVVPLIMRLVEFVGLGHERAVPGVALAEAVVAEAADDDGAVLAALDRIGPDDMAASWMAIVEFQRLVSNVMLARPDEARAAALRCMGLEPGVGRGPLAMASVLSGFDRDVLEILREHDSWQLPLFAHSSMSSFVSVVAAWAGDVALAEKALARARGTVSASMGPELRGSLVLAEATIAIAEGRIDEAADSFGSFLESCPEPLDRRMVRRVTGLTYMLLPDWRDWLDQAELPTLRAENVQTACNLLRLRLGQPVDSGVWPSPARLLTSLPLRWAAEVAVRRWAAGDEAAVDLADHLALTAGDGAWRVIRELASGEDATLATSASSFLSRVPAPSRRPVTVRLLGPTEVVVDGETADDAAFRRKRVRQLLAILALRRSIDRTQLYGMLWPELDERAAGTNLRANLRHLLNALEPERIAGEASFLVRTRGQVLELAGAAYVTTDVELAEQSLVAAEAHAAAGAHSKAMDCFEAAVDAWRGRPLHDLAELPDFVPEAERLTARLATAAVRAAELRLAHGDAPRAAALAERAIAADPWAEGPRRLAIDAAIQLGDRALGRRLADQCRAMLVELDIEPSAETAMALRRAG